MPSLLQRLARLWPYARTSRAGLVGAMLGAVVMAATEPMIPALMNRLLDDGFQRGELPLWMVPVAFIGLFTLRSVAGFVSQYGLAWTATRTVLRLREHLFATLMRNAPSLFAGSSASAMTNTVVYETQSGVTALVSCLLTLVRDTLTLVALLAYLLWLNWQLTLVVALLFPTVAWVMRVLGRRLHRLTVESQKATDELAYVVEENVLAWRIVRLHGAETTQAARFGERAETVKRLMLKGVVAAATMTPVTQILAACALSGVITVALWQSSQGGASVGGFVAFVMAMLQLIAPVKHLSDVMAPLTRGLAAVERGLKHIAELPVERGGTHTGAEAGGAGSREGSRSSGGIRFEAVSLAYREDAPPALDTIDLAVAPARPWRWSAPRAPARARSSTCCRASSTPAAAASRSTACRFPSGTWPRCAGSLRW
jgi:ATP-binding cassette, subfamily B, bacterial MsbA